MKTTSKLLGYLLATSCLVGCSSMNKNVSENTQSTPNNAAIVAGSEADLIQAQSPEQYYEIGRAYQKKLSTIKRLSLIKNRYVWTQLTQKVSPV